MIAIESAEIIASYISRQDTTSLTIKYEKIRKMADILKNCQEWVVPNCDMVSIDAFRCSFPRNVEMKTECLVIKNDEEFRRNIQGYILRKDLMDLIEREFNE